MDRRIRRLGIVNRGESAVRALTAVAELNQAGDEPIQTVVLFTDPDADSWFVREADVAVSLGTATFVDPADGTRRTRYLDEPAVMAALRGADVDAVWVGWGFLAEHASFAQACEEAGITFVGPDSATIRRLGDKVAAKRVAEQADVPVVPWSGGPVEDIAEATALAAKLGYPVVVKAASGGGGRGIRMVRDDDELAAALPSARAEAALAFGDPTVFLEKLVPAARHVEVQVIADGYGTVWAVGVRDCSLQRRHQKVLEESASTVLDAAKEQAIRDAAVRLSAAAGYRNAGTVEFLVDPATGSFQFMEVNTRLQVEHPVTEITTGVDLVKMQLHVAQGGRLPAQQPPVTGHAIEARLNAEDPENGFAPASGRLACLRMPAGTGIRVDAGVREGDRIPADFDSMIAKIIAWGRDRDEAMARLRRALRETTAVVEGGTTNRSFLLTLLNRPEVRAGQFDNHWLDRLTGEAAHLPTADPVALLVAAIESYDLDEAAEQAAFHARAARGGAESAAGVGHRCRLRYRGQQYDLHVYRTGAHTYRVSSGVATADVVVSYRNGFERRVAVGGRTHRVVSVVEGATIRVDVDGAAHAMFRDDGGVVRCGGPAFVLSVLVEPGDRVAEGDPLAVVESMKMENTVTAPFAGTVASVETAAKVQVEAGAPIVRIATADTGQGVAAGAVDFAGLTAAEPPGTAGCEQVYDALRSYLLGYDLDPGSVQTMLTRQRELSETAVPADPELLRCEDELLDLFADVGSLYRPRGETDSGGGAGHRQHPGVSAVVPAVAGRRPGRAARLVPHAAGAGAAALRGAGAGAHPGAGGSGRLDVPVVSPGRRPGAGGDRDPRAPAPPPGRAGALGGRRDARPAGPAGGHPGPPAGDRRPGPRRAVPLLRRAAAGRHRGRRVRAGAAGPRRAERRPRRAFAGRVRRAPRRLPAAVARRVAAPLARHPRCCAAPGAAGGLRPPVLPDPGAGRPGGHRARRVAARLGRLRLEGQPIHLVAAYAPLAKLPELSRAIAGHLGTAGDERQVVVDLALWRHGEAATTSSRRRRDREAAGRLRLRAAAAPARPDRDDARRRGSGAVPHLAPDLPPARRPVRRGPALPQPAPDARQAAGPVAAVELRAAAAALGRGRLRVPRCRARQPGRSAAVRARRGARPHPGPGRERGTRATRGWS